MTYLMIKGVHQAAVALSVSGFVLRWAAGLAGAAWVRGPVARRLPHVVDTVLLLSALALLVTAAINPLQAPWLLAKIAGLLLYIVLGAVALRPGVARPLRTAAGLAALATVSWIVSVALTKHPLGWLSAGSG